MPRPRGPSSERGRTLSRRPQANRRRPSARCSVTRVARKLSAGEADVGASRERIRRNRLTRLALVLCVPLGWLWFRLLDGRGFDILGLSVPSIDPLLLMPALFFLALILLLVGTTVGAGRSPHVTYRPEQIDVRPGRRDRASTSSRRSRPVAEPVPGAQGLRRRDGRHAAARSAVRGRARHRQDLHRQGDGARGRGAVPVRVGDAFQSMYYGATARKIRSYFKAVRKAARTGGRRDRVHRGDRRDRRSPAAGCPRCGAPGALGRARWLRRARPACRRPKPAPRRPCATRRSSARATGGVVNELLVQMQSFDEPTGVAEAASAGSSTASTCSCRRTGSCGDRPAARRTSC